MKPILHQLRVKHYIKNILVFLPLVFSLNLLDFASFLQTFLVFLAFCAASSAVYIVNDIADAPRDRLHPRKKNRPIASGKISVGMGAVMAFLCLSCAVVLSIFTKSLTSGILLLVYLSLNTLYSFVLKKFALVDVFCLMVGFLLRVAAGAAVIGVPVSGWLMLTIMSLSLFMGFGKRRGEIRLTDGTTSITRKVLSSYSAAFLDRAMYSMMTLSAAFYALWAIDGDTTAYLGTNRLIWTTPLVIAGLLRYALLLENNVSDGDPTNVLFTDFPLMCLVPVYGLTVIAMIYFH